MDIVEELVKQITKLEHRLDNLVKPEVPIAGKITPFISCYKSAGTNNVTGDGTAYSVICDTELIDQTGSYDNTTGVFTAPRAGYYLFKFHSLVGNLGAAHTQGQAIIVTSNRSYYSAFKNPFATSFGGLTSLWCEAICDMDSGDTASFQVYVSNGAKTVQVYGDGSILHTRLHGLYLRPLSF